MPQFDRCCSPAYTGGRKLEEGIKDVILGEKEMLHEEGSLNRILCAGANCRWGSYIIFGLSKENGTVQGIKMSESHKKFL